MAYIDKRYESKSDYDLVLAVTEGGVSAFDALLGRYKNLVYSVVLRMMNDKEEANDQAQEVFIKIYRNMDKYKPDYKFSTWVIRIATNHVIDFRRKNKNASATDHLEDMEAGGSMVADGALSPEDAYIAREQSKQLTDMIEDLPDMYKVPIVLYHQQGLSYQEIADIVDEPMSKVKNRIFRARKILKENLMTLKAGESYGM
ncbi:MAG: sigma-70 family RNA polymerase sigma factor [Defluviitaleaceae bacterium]|nr:sigma-70 family RNA polymerase sigma factor [Defluviitaleaceae bacterium]